VRNGTCKTVDVGGLAEQFSGQMLLAPKPGLAKEILPGFALAAADQLLDVIGGKVRTRDDDQAGGCHLRHRVECGERVVAQRLVHHLRR